MGRLDRYRWSEPASQESEGGPAAQAEGWTTLITMQGHWSHCDLWFTGAAGYVGRPWRILGRLGGVWAQLAFGVVGMPPVLVPGSFQLSGLLGSVRSRPADAFQVEIQNTLVALPVARWRLMAWGRESDAPSTSTGGPVPTIWQNRHSAGAVAVYIASAAPCLLNCAFARNDGVLARYFQVHDLAAAPAPGAIPCQPGIQIPGGGQPGSISFDAAQMLNGVVLVSSTTAAVYTVDPAASLDMGALVQ